MTDAEKMDFLRSGKVEQVIINTEPIIIRHIVEGHGRPLIKTTRAATLDSCIEKAFHYRHEAGGVRERGKGSRESDPYAGEWLNSKVRGD